MNKVVVIEHDGKEISLEIGMLAIRLYCENEKCSVEALFERLADQVTNVWTVCDFAFYAAKAFCELNGGEFSYTKLQATEWMASIMSKSDEIMSKLNAMVPSESKKKKAVKKK